MWKLKIENIRTLEAANNMAMIIDLVSIDAVAQPEEGVVKHREGVVLQTHPTTQFSSL